MNGDTVTVLIVEYDDLKAGDIITGSTPDGQLIVRRAA